VQAGAVRVVSESGVLKEKVIVRPVATGVSPHPTGDRAQARLVSTGMKPRQVALPVLNATGTKPQEAVRPPHRDAARPDRSREARPISNAAGIEAARTLTARPLRKEKQKQ